MSRNRWHCVSSYLKVGLWSLLEIEGGVVVNIRYVVTCNGEVSWSKRFAHGRNRTYVDAATTRCTATILHELLKCYWQVPIEVDESATVGIGSWYKAYCISVLPFFPVVFNSI